MTTQYIVFIISFCIGAIVPIFVRWIYDEMRKAKKPKTSTITPVIAKSELQMNVVRTAIQRDRLMLEDSDQVYEYAAKKLLRQIASIIREQLMDNIDSIAANEQHHEMQEIYVIAKQKDKNTEAARQEAAEAYRWVKILSITLSVLVVAILAYIVVLYIKRKK